MSGPTSAHPDRRPATGGWFGAVRTATRLTAERPALWAVALAGFLIRGGLLLFVLPFVVLPTPTGLATLFGPFVISIAISTPNPGVYQLVGGAVVLLVGWLVAMSTIGAMADVEAIRMAAAGTRARRSADDDGPPGTGAGGPPSTQRVGGSVGIVRLVAHLPTVVALVWAASRLVDAVYRQYIFPGDLAVPLPVRVVESIPEVFVVLIVVWLAGEALGGAAARCIVLGRTTSVLRALGFGLARFVRHPVSSLATHLLGFLGLLVVLLPVLGAAAVLWADLRILLLGDAPAGAVVLGTVAFAATWTAALAFAAIGAAWRSSLWTAEIVREQGALAARTAPVIRPAVHPS